MGEILTPPQVSCGYTGSRGQQQPESDLGCCSIAADSHDPIAAMMDDDDDDLRLGDGDEGSDTAVRFQGDRETHVSDGEKTKAELPFQAGQLCGEFQLDKLLGRGSSGCVFRALDTVSRRSCALKILIRPNERDIKRDRIGFRRMMGLRHPSLLRVDQLHRLDGYVALSMEEIHGDTLAKSRRRLCRLDRNIALGKLLSVTRDYASGLAAMHSNGLLHRDIKPSNLMIDRNDTGKIIDYGLVGTFDAEMDSQCYRDYIAGTLRYIAPEAYFDQHYTPAGDIFSLGLTILEFLHAITGNSDWKRDEKNKSHDALLISSAVDELSDAIPSVLRDGCLEMLQVNAGDRPTAMQVARLGLPAGKSTIYMGGQPLFGRETEFQRVCDWAAEIYQGGHGRIHIHGDSGIGKTGLIDAVERHLKSLRWGQVFRARCRPRDSHPMQALDQFADQIASRYASNDRGALHVDPVSAEILHQAFPVLKDVVKKSMRLQMAPAGQDRFNAITAGIKLSEQLRKVGPLIFIVDDAQWADVNSCGMLDEWQVASGTMLGIITVSRQKETLQQHPPNQTLKLKPLQNEIGVRMLCEAAQRWSVDLSQNDAMELANVAAGNPFRLSELADEFRPGGLLHTAGTDTESSLARLGNLNRMCEHRIARLSDEARQLLPLIAIADCGVSINQLEMLTNLGDLIEIAVSELVNQRLVMDDATGGCCIKMLHDRVCDGVIAKLGPAECRIANLAWANLLRTPLDQQDAGKRAAAAADTVIDQASPAGKQAGRIARHLLDAGQQSDAIEYVKLAAIESERAFAFSEAGEWHAKAASIEPQAAAFHLREAARLFGSDDKPARAAECFQALVALIDDDQPAKQQYQIEATKLLLRSGRLHQSYETLSALATKMGLPRPNLTDSWRSIATRSLRIIRGEPRQLHHQPSKKTDQSAASQSVLDRLDFAQSLIRPLAFFDAPYATELFLSIAKQVQLHGTVEQQFCATISSAAFACSDSGAKRNRGTHVLRDIQADAIDAGPRIAGDYWSAKSIAAAFSLDWQSMDGHIQSAVTAYRSHDVSCREQEGQTQWLNLWAMWHLGEWERLSSLAELLVEDAKRRDDQLTQFLSSSGFGSAAWLIDGDTDTLNQLSDANDRHFTDVGYLAKLWQFVQQVQEKLYLGELNSAHQLCRKFARQLSKSHLSRIQLARIIAAQFGALTALHLQQASGESDWGSVADQHIHKLKSERIPCAMAQAALFAGIRSRLSGEQAESRKHLVAAQQLAKEQKLMPLELAARDQIQFLQTGEWQGILRHRMHSGSVLEPEQFERVYTVAQPD